MDPAQISREEWKLLLAPYAAEPADELLSKLEKYLELLLRWNARMNLTAVREPREIIRRHFGESLFLAAHVPRGTLTALDHGSGAGFPGIPLALAHPELKVTLSESQAKKQAFLGEVVRALDLANCAVHRGRTEEMRKEDRFDLVVMRAVDNAAAAYPSVLARVRSGGWLLVLDGQHAPVIEAEPVSAVKIPASLGFLRRYQIR